MKIGIYIPAFNESDNTKATIEKIKEHYPRYDIVVIDDGSEDNTVEIAKRMGVKVYSHLENKGLGAGTRSGLMIAKELGWDIAIKTDMDLQHPIESIGEIVQPIIEDKADMVFGSRFLGTIRYDMPFYRRMGNAFFSKITSFLIGQKVTDGQTGLIAVNKRYLECFELLSNYNETQQLWLDGHIKNMRMVEVAIDFNKRESGKSFISWKYPFKVLPNLLRMYLHAFPLKILGSVGLVMMLLSLPSLFFSEVFLDTLFTTGLIFIVIGIVGDINAKR